MCLLVLFELLPVKLLMLAWNVDPQASLSAYRARAFNLESDAVRWSCRWREIDVSWLVRQIWRAIVSQWKLIDGAVVHLLWRHGGRVRGDAVTAS